jgi:surfeit locus 1 family protein
MDSTSSRRRFWVVLIGALVFSALTASLGFWQLRRADFKAQLDAAIKTSQALAPLVNRDIKGAADLNAWVHRPAELSGRWVPQATVFLDNRQMNGQQGFHVVTPLQLEADGRWILVQRGWSPRDFTDRSRLPAVPTPSGIVVVSGRIAAAPGKVYQLGTDDLGPIRQNLEVASFAQEHKSVVLNGSLLQLLPVEGAEADGLLRNWPLVASGVHKHHGYAFQWFGLCALIVILYVWFQIISPLRSSRKQSDTL